MGNKISQTLKKKRTNNEELPNNQEYFVARSSIKLFRNIYQLNDKYTKRIIIYIYAKTKKELIVKLVNLDQITEYIINDYIDNIKKNYLNIKNTIHEVSDSKEISDGKETLNDSNKIEDKENSGSENLKSSNSGSCDSESTEEELSDLDREIICKLFGSDEIFNDVIENLPEILTKESISQYEYLKFTYIEGIIYLIKRSKIIRQVVITNLIKSSEFYLKEIKLGNVYY